MVSMLYDITCSRTFYDFLLSLMINVVTTLSNVTDVIDHFSPQPRVLKIEKMKNKSKEK